MQYRWPVSDRSCHDGAVRTSATLMTRPHAVFARPGILGVRIVALIPVSRKGGIHYIYTRHVERLQWNATAL